MAALQAEAGDVGAIASFLGIVRRGQENPIEAMTLEHYPGMTERAIARMAAEAESRWPLGGCRVIHRIGADSRRRPDRAGPDPPRRTARRPSTRWDSSSTG